MHIHIVYKLESEDSLFSLSVSLLGVFTLDESGHDTDVIFWSNVHTWRLPNGNSATIWQIDSNQVIIQMAMLWLFVVTKLPFGRFAEIGPNGDSVKNSCRIVIWLIALKLKCKRNLRYFKFILHLRFEIGVFGNRWQRSYLTCEFVWSK